MRCPHPSQPGPDCPAITAVELNLNCRDEIIPILRALQHLYGEPSLRREILDLVGKDVNRGSSRKHGRKGLDYWSITVLAAGARVATWITTSCKTWRSSTATCVCSWALATGRKPWTLTGGGYATTCVYCGPRPW